jgi:hypothetical protein
MNDITKRHRKQGCPSKEIRKYGKISKWKDIRLYAPGRKFHLFYLIPTVVFRHMM